MPTEPSPPDVTCHVHVTESDPGGCEWCQKEMEGLFTMIGALEEQNAQAEAAINRQGAGVNPMMFFQVKLDMLVAAAFQDVRQRAHFEVNYQQELGRMLKEANRQVTQEKLKVSGNQVQQINFRKPRDG